MRKYLILILVITNCNIIYSQTCTNVEELYRKRHKIRDMTYGHPYTTFDRHPLFGVLCARQ